MSRAVALVTATCLLTLLSGCREIGMAGYLLSPRQIEKPQYELSESRVAILIDPPPRAEMHPLFARALHKKTVSLLKDFEVDTQIVPYDETIRLQQDPDYFNWTTQRIGEKLHAAEVIHVQLTNFMLRETEDHPLLNPMVEMRVKVIDSNAKPAKARLWPDDIEGYLIKVERQPREAGSMRDLDREAIKLGNDAAQHLARLFAEWDREETIPVEH